MNTQVLETALREEADRLGAKFGDFMIPLRVAITGSRVGPPLLESIITLGKEETLERIKRALNYLTGIT